MAVTLPRLEQTVRIADDSGNPTMEFHIWWDNFASALEGALNDITNQVASIQAAQNAANTAQSTANTVHTNDSISSSWTSPGSILSASDAGTNATITIATHTRKYNDGTSLAGIAGGSVTGLAYSTKYFVYYDDTTRANTTPVYHAVTDPNAALPGAAAGRHYCGEIQTPASGGAATSGGVSPPGSGGQLSRTDIP